MVVAYLNVSGRISALFIKLTRTLSVASAEVLFHPPPSFYLLILHQLLFYHNIHFVDFLSEYWQKHFSWTNYRLSLPLFFLTEWTGNIYNLNISSSTPVNTVCQSLGYDYADKLSTGAIFNQTAGVYVTLTCSVACGAGCISCRSHTSCSHCGESLYLSYVLSPQAVVCVPSTECGRDFFADLQSQSCLGKKKRHFVTFEFLEGGVCESFILIITS